MASDGKCFTFQWELEKIYYYMHELGEERRSPVFMVKAIEGTKWRIRFFPRGESGYKGIGFYLHREEDGGRDTVEIKYELAFIRSGGQVLFKTSVSKGIFSRGESSLAVKISTIFLYDPLILRCRIWKGDGEMSEDGKCTALTRLGVLRKSYRWDVKNFSSLESGKKINHQIKDHQTDLCRMSVDLYLSEGLNKAEIIHFNLSLQDQTIKKLFLILYLIDSSGNKEDFEEKKVLFDDPTASKQLTFKFTKKYSLERKDVYLPNDTLSLYLIWDFYRVVFEEIVHDDQFYVCSDVKTFDAQNSSGGQTSLSFNFEKNGICLNEERSLSDSKKSLVNAFVDNVKSLYDERFLSDVKLTTANGEFPAHKIILSASSSVFKAMFSSNMKESITNCVTIEDLDDDAVSRMLYFIYTTRVGDLTWVSASNLYKAADKYDISSLKIECSSFLKKHLSSTNACDVLLLADSHADTDLKAVVQDYIIENGRQITTSDEWKNLMGTNAILAAETLCKLFR